MNGDFTLEVPLSVSRYESLIPTRPLSKLAHYARLRLSVQERSGKATRDNSRAAKYRRRAFIADLQPIQVLQSQNRVPPTVRQVAVRPFPRS